MALTGTLGVRVHAHVNVVKKHILVTFMLSLPVVKLVFLLWFEISTPSARCANLSKYCNVNITNYCNDNNDTDFCQFACLPLSIHFLFFNCTWDLEQRGKKRS